MIKTNHRIIKDNFIIQETELSKKRLKYEPFSMDDIIPITWNKAKDFSIFDDEGNKWIDMTSGAFVTNAGHSNKYVNDSIKKQLDDDLSFSFVFNTHIKYKFIEKLLNTTPNYLDKVMILSSGTEVTDLSYKLVKHWGKKNNRRYIITFNGSYHGRALSSELICGEKQKASWSRINDDDIIFLDFPYDENTEFDTSKLPPANEICAFFLETYQGWGAWMYPQHYIDKLNSFAKENNILLCFDEIQAGLYRMGTLFGYMNYGKDIQPDLVCLAKGLSAPLPMSVLLGKKEVLDVKGGLDVASTHTGNPVCCASGIANIDFLTDETFQTKLKKSCNLFGKLNKRLEKISYVERVNTKGLVSGIIVDTKERARDIVERCISNGVWPVLTHKNSIKLAPPLTISLDAIEESMNVLSSVMEYYE